MNFFATLFGGLGMALGVGSYLQRSHRALTLTGALGVVCWALHFAAQGFWTPCVLSALMSVRIAAGVFVIDLATRTRWALTTLAWALTGAGAWLTWHGYVSVPSTAATLWLTYAGFHLSYKPLRWALLAGEALWFCNGWVTDSWMALTASAIGLALNTAMIVRERNASSTT